MRLHWKKGNGTRESIDETLGLVGFGLWMWNRMAEMSNCMSMCMCMCCRLFEAVEKWHVSTDSKMSKAVPHVRE